jgi:hypothetical protein
MIPDMGRTGNRQYMTVFMGALAAAAALGIVRERRYRRPQVAACIARLEKTANSH